MIKLADIGGRFWNRCERAGRMSVSGALLVFATSNWAATNVYLTEVPDYEWHVGCFGTATGNLMGYWDRHGFPNFYTGPTGYGVAPLNSFGDNYGIRSLWATQAGMDGRPDDDPGHFDDYYRMYANTDPDPCVSLGRPEHQPDCLGDFIGLNQRKWTNLNGECDGNIDGYSFVYWDSSGERRVNFTPGPDAGLPAIDLQSGLRAWTRWRGYTADVFTQLSDFNPETMPGKGFSFADLKAEIDAGYPVLFFLQEFRTKSRWLQDMARANPLIHGLLAYGYRIGDDGSQYVRFRSSFAGGDNEFVAWTSAGWWGPSLPLRGVIGYHPLPQITEVFEAEGNLVIRWDGPDSHLYDVATGTTTRRHWYVVEKATSLADADFTPVAPPTAERMLTVPIPDPHPAYFRLKMVPPPEVEE